MNIYIGVVGQIACGKGKLVEYLIEKMGFTSFSLSSILHDELKEKGILVRADSRATLDEELPEAYKDVTEVVDIVENAGISKKVAQLRPLCVIKG